MKSFKDKLNNYAKLCVKVGINLQEGEPLVINAPIEGADFVRLLAKNAYELGASEVHVNWNDETLTKLNYENSPMEIFENFPKWKADSLEYYAEKGAGFLSISASDPEMLKEIDPKKIAASNKASSLALKNFRKYTMNDINSWCVVSIPTKSWAKSVFTDVSEDEAYEKLWDAIFTATRMNEDDPIKAWEDHIANLTEKNKFLNKQKLTSLHYKASNGTDLIVKIPKGHIWVAGGGYNSKGTYFVANMPTEEVFTMPDKYGVDGVVYSTKPLIYGGKLIDEFKLTFKDGKVVDYDAKVGKEVLEDLFKIDEGAMHLGEVALVPHESPISQSNILFKNTLFDENASCHFAFGKAYPTNIEGGTDMSDEELEAHGVNNSLTHVDFMIGSKDMNIIGTTETGQRIQIFKDGNWAI